MTTGAVSAGPIVLVVDDHPVNRLVMRRQLVTLGYSVEEVDSGAAALERWNSGKFALVVTDCHMPGMSGYELSRRIRDAEAAAGMRRTPIIACSADALAGAAGKCMDAGMDDYISKPIELRLLAEMVSRWMPRSDSCLEADTVPATYQATAIPAPGLEMPHGRTPDSAETTEPAPSKRVIELFRRVNEEDVRGLLGAVDEGDMQGVSHFAHRIKGACGFIGATPLASVCGMVEQAGRDEDRPGVAGLMDIFHTELEQLNAHLDAH